LAWPDEDDQWPGVAVAEVVDLGAEPTARTADPMISRLGEQILVIR